MWLSVGVCTHRIVLYHWCLLESLLIPVRFVKTNDSFDNCLPRRSVTLSTAHRHGTAAGMYPWRIHACHAVRHKNVHKNVEFTGNGNELLIEECNIRNPILWRYRISLRIPDTSAHSGVTFLLHCIYPPLLLAPLPNLHCHALGVYRTTITKPRFISATQCTPPF